MNDTAPQPDRRLRALIYILLCLLGYLAVVIGDYFCMKNRMYDWRTGLAVLFSLSALTFLLALVALFRPFEKSGPHGR